MLPIYHEFMVIATPHYQTTYRALQPAVMVGGIRLHAVSSHRNLGVVMDSTMDMHGQIQSVKCAMFHHLRTVGNIRRLLDRDTCVNAVLSLVMSRVDYGDSLLVGQSAAALRGPQQAQNYAALLVMCLRQCDHVTPALQTLHWLPIHAPASLLQTDVPPSQNPIHQWCTSVHDVHGQPICTPGGAPGSASATMRLAVPRTRLACADRCVSVSAPPLWNVLPPHLHHCSILRTFKTNLKTHVFRQHLS